MFRIKLLIYAGALFTSILILSSNIIAEEISDDIKFLSAEKSYELIEKNKRNPEFIILDVRTSDEYNSGHIANALNIDYKSADFKNNVSKLDRDKTYITYCHSGRRSTAASKIMEEMGFDKIYMINGGIIAWEKDNFPTEN